MYVADGETMNLCGLSGTAVGWLERGHSFPTGKTPTRVIDQLAELLSGLVWEPDHFMGYHHCELRVCRIQSSVEFRLSRILPAAFFFSYSDRQRRLNNKIADGADKSAPLAETARAACWALGETLRRAVDPHPYSQFWKGRRVQVGATNLYVPEGDTVYIAPSMILHYICRHRYRPPDSFCDALIDCLPMGSQPYLEALRPGLGAVSTQEFVDWVSDQADKFSVIAEWIRTGKRRPFRGEEEARKKAEADWKRVQDYVANRKPSPSDWHWSEWNEQQSQQSQTPKDRSSD
jgi:hypothetical protein